MSFVQKLFDVFRKLKLLIWRVVHIPHSLFLILKIYKKFGQGESFFSFYKKLWSFKKLCHSKKHRQDLKNGVYEIHDFGIAQKYAGKQIAYIDWHHGVQDLEPMLETIDDFLMVTALDYGINNFFNINKASYKNTVAILFKNILAGKSFGIAFDGGLGKKYFKTKYLGIDYEFPRGLMYVLKKTQPVVVVQTAYFDEQGKTHIYLNDEVFKEGELQSLSEEQILERLINFFEEDLKKQPGWQISYWWLLRRLYGDEFGPRFIDPWYA